MLPVRGLPKDCVASEAGINVSAGNGLAREMGGAEFGDKRLSTTSALVRKEPVALAQS
jgi:hypothetical protein